MIHFGDAGVQKGVLFDLHLPAPVGFAIMRSHGVHGGGVEVVTPEVFPLDVHCVNSTMQKTTLFPLVLHDLSHLIDFTTAFSSQRNLQWEIRWFKVSLPVYRKENKNENKQNIMLCVTSVVLLTWYFPTSPYFSSLKRFLCWKIGFGWCLFSFETCSV